MTRFRDLGRMLPFALVILAQVVWANDELDEWVLLTQEHVDALLQQCSRPVPNPVDGVWDPSGPSIAALEARIENVEKLEAKDCCLPGARIEDVHAYNRQYVGIVVEGRRLVYINALPREGPLPSREWRKAPVVFCDGGKLYWGAVFEPATGMFSALAFNGEF